MKDLRTWLAQIGRRQARAPDLFAALISGRATAYAAHRLRFMVPRILLRVTLYSLEVYFLSRMLPWEMFAPLLSYRALCAWLGASHWGALEALRSRVREQARRREFHAARRTIASWLKLFMLIALTISVLTLSWALRHTWDAAGHGLSLSDAYGMACFLRLTWELVAKTYHSGIFAIRRVYRPTLTLMLPDVLELALVLAAWRQLGPWGFPLAIVLTGCLRAAWIVHYARRTYSSSRIPAMDRRTLREAPLPSFRELRASLVHALANASTQLDALLLLVLANVPTAAGNYAFLALFYALRPVISAAHGWTRVFYFDFKRLEHGFARAFQPRLRALLRRVALVMALVVSLTLLLITWLVASSAIAPAAWWMVPFLFVRSVSSLEQLRAFSLEHYRALAMSSALTMVGMAAVAWSAPTQTMALLGVTLALLLSILLLTFVQQGVSGKNVQTCTVAPGLAGWLSALCAHKSPIAIGYVTIDRKLSGLTKVKQGLSPLLAGGGMVRVGRTHLLWWSPQSSAPRRAALLTASAGTLSECFCSEAADGAAALQALDATGFPRRTIGLDLCTAADNIEKLRASFAQQFPQGSRMDLTAGQGVLAGPKLSAAARRSLLRQIVLAARGLNASKQLQTPYELAVYAPRGLPGLVFAVPRGAPGFSAFAQHVFAATLAASCGVRAKTPA